MYTQIKLLKPANPFLVTAKGTERAQVANAHNPATQTLLATSVLGVTVFTETGKEVMKQLKMSTGLMQLHQLAIREDHAEAAHIVALPGVEGLVKLDDF